MKNGENKDRWTVWEEPPLTLRPIDWSQLPLRNLRPPEGQKEAYSPSVCGLRTSLVMIPGSKECSFHLPITAPLPHASFCSQRKQLSEAATMRQIEERVI